MPAEPPLGQQGGERDADRESGEQAGEAEELHEATAVARVGPARCSTCTSDVAAWLRVLVSYATRAVSARSCATDRSTRADSTLARVASVGPFAWRRRAASSRERALRTSVLAERKRCSRRGESGFERLSAVVYATSASLEALARATACGASAPRANTRMIGLCGIGLAEIRCVTWSGVRCSRGATRPVTPSASMLRLYCDASACVASAKLLRAPGALMSTRPTARRASAV
jgi:hypothetical protein